MPQGVGQLTRLEKLSEFVIAKDNCVSKNIGGLAELHGLNNLRGRLSISNLRYLKNPKSEFKAANLSAKQQLTELILLWNDYKDDGGDCSAEDVDNDERGLEALQPNPSLKTLIVVSYRGLKTPSWLTSLTHLVWICFENCKSIQWLPSFDHLPCLKHFWIFKLTNLEFIDVVFENGGSVSFFPSLTSFSVTDCPNLKGFMRHKSNSRIKPLSELPCFPSVSTLKIGNCSNLNHMPLFPELKILVLRGDGVKTMKEILKKNAECTYSPFTALSQLEELTYSNMEEFSEDEMLQYPTCLQSLFFFECNFKTMASDENDGGMQWKSLRALTSVAFVDTKNLISIPKGLQYVSTLQRLRIRSCSSLVCMPEWMPNLKTLQHLTVIDCPQLSERCKNNQAEDWHKISHIPNISIDEQSIQRNGCYLL